MSGVWWKEGVDEALHKWSKHNQQSKVAKWQLSAIACDVKLEVIFCGICVHELCFLAFYENYNYSLLTVPVMWWGVFLGCIFCGMISFPLELWWWSVEQWSWMEIKGHNWSKVQTVKVKWIFFFALGWRKCFWRF